MITSDAKPGHLQLSSVTVTVQGDRVIATQSQLGAFVWKVPVEPLESRLPSSWGGITSGPKAVVTSEIQKHAEEEARNSSLARLIRAATEAQRVEELEHLGQRFKALQHKFIISDLEASVRVNQEMTFGGIGGSTATIPAGTVITVAKHDSFPPPSLFKVSFSHPQGAKVTIRKGADELEVNGAMLGTSPLAPHPFGVEVDFRQTKMSDMAAVAYGGTGLAYAGDALLHGRSPAAVAGAFGAGVQAGPKIFAEKTLDETLTKLFQEFLLKKEKLYCAFWGPGCLDRIKR
jgi:hypothetical protein